MTASGARDPRIDRRPGARAGRTAVRRRSRAGRSVYLALKLQRPLLLEGEAGVGKTEIAKVLAAALRTSLIRLQCYEGLDISHAVYEWNYPRQLLEIRLMERRRIDAARETLQRRVSHQAPAAPGPQPTGGGPPVLLIDELDRADEEFEGYLLEMLADFQITIPELGTIRAAEPPDRHHHVQPHARGSRRTQTALSVPLDRVSGLSRKSCASSPRRCRAPRRGWPSR